jgi:hypothetical protein
VRVRSLNLRRVEPDTVPTTKATISHRLESYGSTDGVVTRNATNTAAVILVHAFPHGPSNITNRALLFIFTVTAAVLTEDDVLFAKHAYRREFNDCLRDSDYVRAWNVLTTVVPGQLLRVFGLRANNPKPNATSWVSKRTLTPAHDCFLPGFVGSEGPAIADDDEDVSRYTRQLLKAGKQLEHQKKIQLEQVRREHTAAKLAAKENLERKPILSYLSFIIHLNSASLLWF